MTVIHANAPTTKFLSCLYETRKDVIDVKSELTTFNYSRLYFLDNDLKR